MRKISIANLLIVVTAIVCIVFGSFAPVSAATGNPLKGKKVLVDGDSIQWSFGEFAATAAKKMGAKKVNNIAYDSATLAAKDGRKNSVYYRIHNMSYKKLKKYDYVIIAAGTNDWYSFYRVRPGKVKSKNTETTAGALNATIKRIQKASSKTKIIVITPIHRFKGGNCSKKKNWCGSTLSDYRRIIRKVAEQYDGVYVISGLDLTTAAEMKKWSNTKDGLHPRPSYAKKISKRLIKQIKTVMNTEEENK